MRPQQEKNEISIEIRIRSERFRGGIRVSHYSKRLGLAFLFLRSSFVLGFLASSLKAWAGLVGTTLTGSKTSSVVVTQTSSYTWSLQKTLPTPLPSPFTIGLGSSATVNFSIQATQRGPVVTSSLSPVSGQVCVQNTGAIKTQGLYITDQLEQKSAGVWVKIAGPMVIPVASEISPGQTACFPYQFIGASLDSTLSYQNHAMVSIDNYAGFEGMSHVIDLYSPVIFSTQFQSVDAAALLSDLITCPAGMTCTPASTSQTLIGSSSLSYPITIQNNSVCCGQTWGALNTATLTPTTTQIPQNSSVGLQIFTGTCPPCGSGTGFNVTNVSDSHLVISPGMTLIAGYNFKIPGSHPTTDLILLNGTITIHVTCPNTTFQDVVIPLGLKVYTDPLNSSAWYPTDSQSDPAGFQGSAVAPSNLCGGVSGVASTGATFAGVFSSLPVGQCPNVRFHYQPAPIGAGANWSNTNVQVCGTCGPACAPVLQKLGEQLDDMRKSLEADLDRVLN